MRSAFAARRLFEARGADKAFDSNWIIADLNKRGAGIVISQRPQRTAPLVIDAEMYNWRHLIEDFFCKLKEFKRIAMRSDKTDGSFAALIHLCAAASIRDASQQALQRFPFACAHFNCPSSLFIDHLHPVRHST